MKKALQIAHFRARGSVSDRAVGSGRSRGSSRQLSRPISRSSSCAIARGQLVRRARVVERGLRRRPARCFGSLRRRLRKGSRSEAQARRRSLAERSRSRLERSPPRAAASSNAQVEEPALTCSVPSRAIRAGQAFAAIGLTDRGRPGRHDVGHPRRRAEAVELPRGPRGRSAPSRRPHQLVPSPRWATSSSCAGSPGSALRRRARDERLAAGAQTLGENVASAGVELREHVVEQQQRRLAPRRSASSSASAEQEREHREALLALRAEACAGRGRRRAIADVVEVRAEPGRPALEIALERGPRGRPRSAARPRTRALRPAGRARAARSANARREQPRRVSCRAGDELASEARDLLGPGRERVAGREALRDPPQRRVALAERRAVLGRQRRAAGEQPAEHAVEVRAPGGGPALHDRESVGREDERRRPRRAAARRLAAARRSARRACRSPSSSVDLELEPRAGRGRPASAIRAASRAEADELRVGPRPRREALRPDVQRLEQVRLAGAVRPDGEHEPGPRARARARAYERKFAERDRRRRSAGASRIGMIRYEKSSSSPWRTAGPERADQLAGAARRRSTDSIPSRRNSALKPISSGSP